MVMFAHNAFRNTDLRPTEYEQQVEGDKYTVHQRIVKLCGFCLNKDYDRDCYVLEVSLLSDQITQDMFTENVNLLDNLTQGTNVIKIVSKDGVCEVFKIA